MAALINHDGLTQFKRVASRGTKIVPDLAPLPTPTDGGKTYVFHIRPGIVLRRHDDEAERLCPHVRAAIHRSRPDVVLFRNRRRGQMLDKEM